MMVLRAVVLRPELPELPLPLLRLGADVSVGDDPAVGVEVKVCGTGVPLTIWVVVTSTGVWECVVVELASVDVVEAGCVVVVLVAVVWVVCAVCVVPVDELDVDEAVWDWLEEEDVDELVDDGPVLVVDGAIVDVCDDCELEVSVLVALLGVLVGAAVAAVPVLVRMFDSKFCLSSNSPAPTTVAEHRERPRRSNEERILTRELC